jgi:DNA polymerase alpha-associated DNA helicase A
LCCSFVEVLAYTYYRPGDLARIEENVSSSGPSKKATKGKKIEGAATKTKAAEGVVYKVI